MKLTTCIALSLLCLTPFATRLRAARTSGPADASSSGLISSDNLAMLKQQRIAALKQGFDDERKRYSQGLIAFVELRQAESELLGARLDAADGPASRLQVLDEMLPIVQAIGRQVQQRSKAGLCPAADLPQATADRLYVQILDRESQSR